MSCFFYNGSSVRKYCLKNGIDYMRFYYWMERGQTVEYSLQRAKETAENGTRNVKYFYKGVPLIEYCRKKDLCYNMILKKVSEGYSIDEAIHKKFKRTGVKPKYKYMGMSLSKFCAKNKISYNAVYYRILKGGSINSIMSCFLKSKSV